MAKADRKRKRTGKSRLDAGPPSVDVSTAAAERDKSIVDVLKGEARTGLPGLLVSVALHAVVLVMMAVIVLTIEHANDDTIEFGWLAGASKTTTTAMASEAGPVKLQSFKLNGTQPVTGDKEPEQSAGRTKPGVKPVDVSKSLLTRSEDARAHTLESMGEKDTVRQAVERALGWFKRNQRQAGNWQMHEGYPDAGYKPLRTDTGATALALLCFLGNGHTHVDGGLYAGEIDKGLKWLKGSQKPDGDFHDFNEFGRQTAYYAHSMATIAYCEAYAMTNDRDLREPAEKAIQFLLESQQPVQGGWKYNPQDADTMGDLSVTGWALMALHSARIGGIEVPDTAFGLSSVFLDACAVSDGARYKYEPKESLTKVTPAMTASGLVARQWLGWERDDPFLREGVDWLLQDRFKPEWNSSRRNIYEWYYIAQVLHNLGGDRWRDWYAQAASQVCANQKTRGSRKPPTDIAGSWAPSEIPTDEHSHIGGRLYMTAMCVLLLETPYRHAPLYAPPAAETEAVEAADAGLSE